MRGGFWGSLLVFLARSTTAVSSLFCALLVLSCLVLKADQWLETCWKELEVPAQALAAASGNQAVIAEAKRHLLSFLATANTTLSTRCVQPFARERVC